MQPGNQADHLIMFQEPRPRVLLDIRPMYSYAPRVPLAAGSADSLRHTSNPLFCANTWNFSKYSAIDAAANDPSDERRNPEEPQLTQGPASGKNRDTGATRRIDRRICDGNADE